MRIQESLCRDCPECIHCGRNEETAIWHVCDRCGSEEQLYIFEKEELCADCLLEEFEEVDMEE